MTTTAYEATESTPGSRTTAAAECDVCVPLNDDTILLAEGEDARSYLHSQFSSDLQNTTPERSILTGYSDPRGRLLALPRVLPRTPTRYSLILDREIVESTAQQLRKYALRARVRFTAADRTWQGLGVAGAAAAALLSERLGPLPEEVNGLRWTADGLALVRLPDNRPRWMVWGPETAIEALRAHCADTGFQDGPDVWRRLDIEAALPRIRAATSGRFVAQMVNLDRLGGLDFRKGCYPGQEVIARTRYLGRIKRRMFILQAPCANAAPPAGTAVQRPGDGATVGEIVAAAPATPGCLALAVLRLDAIDGATDGPLQLGTAESAVVTVIPPPYGLDAGNPGRKGSADSNPGDGD